MKIINNKRVQVFTSEELSNVLKMDNGYDYIYLGNSIVLDNGISINENKIKITIDGTYEGFRYKLTGINSTDISDTIIVSENNKEVIIKNMDIESTNTYGVVYVPLDRNYSDVVVTYENIKFNGTELSYNPYGTTKIIDSTITIETTNNVDPQEVCDSDRVILGGNTTISSGSTSTQLFYFRNDTINPSVIFLCKSKVSLTTPTQAFMNGTNKLNFTILHDTEVDLTTGNGFAAYTTHGANNVLIEERASLKFIENKHQRIPMWSVFGNFIMEEGAKLQLINSFDNTPSDNYNIHFKGNNQQLILNNPNVVAIYTKNANVIYTNNPLIFKISCSRINMWKDSTSLVNAGGIYDLPDYYWYKEKELVKFEGTLTSKETTITNHNLTEDELNKLFELSNFSFHSKKQFSIGNIITNIHAISSTKNKISGHTASFAEVLIKYNDVLEIVSANGEGLFEHIPTSLISDNTEIEIISNIPSSFIYETRKIIVPYSGELSLMETETTIVFSLISISSNHLILAKNKNLLLKIVDSRINSSNWKVYASISGPLTSQHGYVLRDALIFKTFDDADIVLTKEPQLIYTGNANNGEALRTVITYSNDKGPLLDLSNNFLEANEEYFTNVYFKIEE